MNRRVVMAILLLAAFGLATWWWLSRQHDTAADTAVARHPDAYFRQLDALRHDAAGRPGMRVRAEYAEHFPDDPWIHLQGVDARGAAGTDLPWRLSADRGRLSDDGAHLEVEGNVRLVREEEGTVPLRLAAERLSVDSEKKLATSDTVVTVSQGSSRIRGRGLRASLADEHIRLENEVEAWFEK